MARGAGAEVSLTHRLVQLERRAAPSCSACRGRLLTRWETHNADGTLIQAGGAATCSRCGAPARLIFITVVPGRSESGHSQRGGPLIERLD